MPKTTLIGITQVEGKPTIVQVDVLEDGVLNPRLGYEKTMSAAEVIALVCQIYDVPYNFDVNNFDVIQPAKAPYKCKHCHKTFMNKIACCDRCAGKVKKND